MGENLFSLLKISSAVDLFLRLFGKEEDNFEDESISMFRYFTILVIRIEIFKIVLNGPGCFPCVLIQR